MKNSQGKSINNLIKSIKYVFSDVNTWNYPFF